MAHCERPTLSLLLRNQDGTTIAALVGAALGSFVLGAILGAFVARFCGQRKSRDPRSSFIQRRPDSTIKPSPIQEPFTIPISPQSLSQTFMRHSVKPPMNMFSTDGMNMWTPSYRRDKLAGSRMGAFNFFASVDSTVYASGSESNCELTRKDTYVIPLAPSESRETVNGGDLGSGSKMRGAQIIRTKSEPSRKLSVDIAEMQITSDEATIPANSRPLRPLPSIQGGVHRAKSESRPPHTAKDRTDFHLAPVPDTRRARAFSTPQQGVNFSNEAIHMPERDGIRITVTSYIETNEDGDMDPGSAVTMSDGQGAQLTRQLSNSQAASFYQAQAKRHLSMPFIGPRSSPSSVRPDSPTGVIGDVDLLPGAPAFTKD